MKILITTPIRHRPDRCRRSVFKWLGLACLVLTVAAPIGLIAGEAWYPLEVDVWTPPFNETLQRQSDSVWYVVVSLHEEEHVPKHSGVFLV